MPPGQPIKPLLLQIVVNVFSLVGTAGRRPVPLGLGGFCQRKFRDVTGLACDRIGVRVQPEIVVRFFGMAVGARYAVVVHGGVIGSVLSQATRSEPIAFVGADNASISHLVAHEGRLRLRRFNDTSHLSTAVSTETSMPT